MSFTTGLESAQRRQYRLTREFDMSQGGHKSQVKIHYTRYCAAANNSLVNLGSRLLGDQSPFS